VAKATQGYADNRPVEPKTSQLPIARSVEDDSPQGERLLVASRLASSLAGAQRPEEVAEEAVRQLHESFEYYLAVVQRLDPDGYLRVVTAAGPLTEASDFLARKQSVDVGVNGRVARTGRAAMVNDTSRNPDYLVRDPSSDPGSELSLPIPVAGSTWGVINLEQQARGAFTDEDLLLANIVASQVGSAIYRCRLVSELQGAFLTTVGLLADAVELQDAYTADHANEVAELALRVGRRLGLGAAELDRLRYGALLHDIGKIGIPGELLRKPGPLTAKERARMQQHTVIGARMLERIPFLAPVAPLVRSAHERFDGNGYPDGLLGGAIPRSAMIIATCDAYHAMTSNRSYRRAIAHEEAIAELRAHSGTQFDPEVASALIAELA
jgi:putative nucleotidyltransferase with HDIG domain